jgi:hypothetical protein
MISVFDRARWWVGLGWPILVISLCGYIAIDYAHRQSQKPAVAKTESPVKHFSLFIPWQAVTLPHACSYNIRDGRVECVGEGSYPHKYWAVTVLSDMPVNGRLFHVVRLNPNQGFTERCYLLDDKDLLRLP